MAVEQSCVSDKRIAFEDPSILLFDKPSGMQTHGSANGFIEGAQDTVRQLRGDNWSAMHRLDRDTSGLLLFGSGRKIRAMLQEQFIGRKVRKIYLAIVKGEFNSDILGIIAPLKHYPEEGRVKVETTPEAKKAASSFQVLDVMQDTFGQVASRLKVRIYTGRTHQIRVHLSHLGNPIIGDPWYNPDPVEGQRLLLHAHQISFTHPITQKQVTFTSQVPEDFLINPNLVHAR